MFQNLETPVLDSILSLMAEFRADARPDIIDLSIGVYKDDNGLTPIMSAVTEAERRLLDQQTSKSYLGMTGDAAFGNLMTQLVLADSIDPQRVACSQTPGGSGALRIAAEIIKKASPNVGLWLSEPTWANHFPLLGTVGLNCQSYAYFDAQNQCVDFDAMMSSVSKIPAGDVIVLHGCCHNPTGADLTQEQWVQLAECLADRSIIPLIDLAYLGLGDGLEADAFGTREIVSRVPEALIAASCSKNFGAYRDRVGCTIAISDSPATISKVFAQMASIARTLYSMPPDHGAAVVRIILSDEQLKNQWSAELVTMQRRIQGLRQGLANTLIDKSGSDHWHFIARQKGMFSLLGTSDEGVERLKTEFGIYVVKGGRVNLAGLNDAMLDRVSNALLAVHQ